MNRLARVVFVWIALVGGSALAIVPGQAGAEGAEGLRSRGAAI